MIHNPGMAQIVDNIRWRKADGAVQKRGCRSDEQAGVRTKVKGASLAVLNPPPKELCALLSVPPSIAAIRPASDCISEFRVGRSVDAEEDERSSWSSCVLRPAVTPNHTVSSVVILTYVNSDK